MVMSQGTYTFLACFAGFWLVWAAVVMLCCFCSFLQRRLKRRHDERLREQCLRSVEMETLGCHSSSGYPPPSLPPAPPASAPAPPPPPATAAPPQMPREPPQFGPPQTLSPPVPLQVPHPMPQANWVSMPDSDLFGKPPCYEEAVLMEDPPPPYSEVLADPRGGTYLKPAPIRAAPLLFPSLPPSRSHHEPAQVFTSETSKPPVMFPERGYSSLIRLPSSQRWDSLGHLLSNMELNHSHTPPPPPPPWQQGGRSIQAPTAVAVATMPRRETRTHHSGHGIRGGLQGGVQRLRGGVQGLQGGIQGLQERVQGLQRGFPELQGAVQGLQGGLQGLQGGVQGLRGGIHGFQGGIQGFQGSLQGVHGLRGLEPSCGLPTAFPLLGRSTAV